MARLILVLGTPGVGKSTLARGLARKLRFQLVDLTVLVKRAKLYLRFDSSKGSYVIDEVRVARRLHSLLFEKDLVVSSHSIGQAVKPSWVELALVLRLDPLVLYKRLIARGWTKPKAWENVESELIDMCLCEAIGMLGKKRVFEIDTTSKSPLRVLTEALRIVKDRSPVSVLGVDWLRTYDPVELERKLHWKSSSLS